jgi:5-methylcytosine-specific restriction endonuclease McrA
MRYRVRWCARCSSHLTLDHFKGEQTTCLACLAVVKAKRAANPGPRREYAKRYAKEHAAEIRAYYQRPEVKVRMLESSRASYARNSEAKRALRKAYYKAHIEEIAVRTAQLRLANIDARREKDRNYRAAHLARLRELERARYAKDPAKFVTKTMRYYYANREIVEELRKLPHRKLASQRAARARYLANVFACRKKSRDWMRAHPEVSLEARRTRRAKLAAAPGGGFTVREFAALVAAYKKRCAYCERPLVAVTPEAEHMNPIDRGGADHIANIAPSCPACNDHKHTRTPEELHEVFPWFDVKAFYARRYAADLQIEEWEAQNV